MFAHPFKQIMGLNVDLPLGIKSTLVVLWQFLILSSALDNIMQVQNVDIQNFNMPRLFSTTELNGRQKHCENEFITANRT